MSLRTRTERIADARRGITKCRVVAADARRVLLGTHPTLHIESTLCWLTANSTLQNAIHAEGCWLRLIEQIRKGMDVESRLEGA